MYVLKIDTYSHTDKKWVNLLTSDQKKLFVTNFEDWEKTPTLNRNTAKPLFGEGVIASPIAYYDAKYFSVNLTYIGDTLRDLHEFKQNLDKTSQPLAWGKPPQTPPAFRVFKTFYENGQPITQEWLDATVEDQFITSWTQYGSVAELTLNFVAHNPHKNFTQINP